MKCLPTRLQSRSKKPGKIGVRRAGLQHDCYWRFATFCRDRTADAGNLTTEVAEDAEAAGSRSEIRMSIPARRDETKTKYEIEKATRIGRRAREKI
jgi:hypothetical protein